PLGPDAALARDHRSHQLVGVETALHQRFNPARGHKADRLGGGIVAMRRRDELEPADVEVSLFGYVSKSLRRGHEDRLDQAELVGFDCAAKRDVVARVRDGDLDSRLVLRGGDQALVLFAADRFSGFGLVSHVRSPVQAFTSFTPSAFSTRPTRVFYSFANGPGATRSSRKASSAASASGSPTRKSFGSALTARSSSRRTSWY